MSTQPTSDNSNLHETVKIADDEELLDILEPHYANMGFAWGEEAREAAKKSVTYKQLKARDAAIRKVAEQRGFNKGYSECMKECQTS